MNRPIVRLYGFVLLLFAVLVAFTSRWTIFEASSLRSNPLNRRGLIAEERIPRGNILAHDGTVLAHSVRSSEGTYKRTYPTGSLFAQTIGYAFVEPGETGLEAYRNNALEGRTDTSNLQTILNQLQGKRTVGDDVTTTLRPHAQRVALNALGEHEGAVVALEPKSGAVEVMASTPTYDPNQFATRAGATKVNHEKGSPSLNRAVQYGHAPGSTFKLVTATAALNEGLFTPQSTLSGRNDILVSGVPLGNDNNESFGEVSLTQALAQSINTVWAQVAERVGKATMAKYMRRFGFNRTPRLDYPAGEMSASGEYYEGHLLSVTSPLVDVGRMGIGQDKLQVTPLQMAEVVSAIANHGTLMVPHLTERIVDSEGRTVTQVKPKVQSVVMKPATAEAITTMMEAVVNEGTGTPAQIPGVQVAGKTGTAETQVGNAINDVWFVAFAPASDPRVAVAVNVNGVSGYGATYAAPVAREVMEALLHE